MKDSGKPHSKIPSCFALKDDLFPIPGMVTLPANEIVLLTRIAKVAVEYSRTRKLSARVELFRLAEEWRNYDHKE